jgi:glycerophosphoryl diester phosphodiesterase
MLLLGHRGCRGEFMENTLAAFDHAMECGCDGFEFDVRLSADGIPVVWHDARLRGRAIARHDFGNLRERCARESPHIRQLRADAGHPPPKAPLKPKEGLNGPPATRQLRADGYNPRRGAIVLCCLEEILARYAHVAWMDIELKARGLEAAVVELVRRYRPARGFVLSSFRRPVLLELHRIDAGLPLAFIFDRMPREKTWRELPVQFVKPSARLVTAARVRQFHGAGMKVLTWTVNHPAAMRRLSEAGVDGMIGDDPRMLAQGR